MKPIAQLFYTAHFIPGDQQIELSGEESRHAKSVLRKNIKENIELTDGRGHHIQGIISRDSRNRLTVEVINYQKVAVFPENQIEVGLATIRPNRMAWAVEKLTELGVKKIVPFISQYTSYHQVNIAHLGKVIISALKQSKQFYLPEISQPVNFTDWLNKIKKRIGKKYIASLHGSNYLESPVFDEKIKKCYVAIGPEGGFHESELDLADRDNFKVLNLGPTILRTETAAVVAVTRLKQML
jgi:16S rRNA (uracil1498-N3)-methyltransferase